MKTLKFIVIAAIFFLAGFFLGQSYQPTADLNSTANQPAQPTAKTVVYILQYASGQADEFQDVELKPGQTVLDVLKEITVKNKIALATKDYQDLGTLVQTIGDKTNGQDNKYWQYFVNGELAKVGAGGYQLTGGERVEWKFIEFQKQ
ncbi:MAG: DUF4430 domain-containing protein [Candidatus Komeilibacteria bacterium]|nr:DUF4430 domain-containing protein [Candidatus Komeilibacteria bacterium]